MHKRILVAEDDTMQRHLISLLLGWHDYDVHVAEDGADAVRKCLTGGFRLVLMDYRLPVIDGHSAAKLIAHFTRDGLRPDIVALTSSADRLRDEEAGAPSVFAAIQEKPWDPSELVSTLDRLFTARSATGRPIVGSGQAGGTFEAAGQVVPDLRREIALLAGHRSPGPARILVAEDDELVRSLLTAALARHFEVDSASNGFDALMMLGERPYDVALLDYRLPKIDGLAAAQLVHDLLPAQQRPRLIALTSSAKLVRDEDDGPPFAFDAVLSKSHDLQHVLAAIGRSLCNQGSLRATG